MEYWGELASGGALIAIGTFGAGIYENNPQKGTEWMDIVYAG